MKARDNRAEGREKAHAGDDAPGEHVADPIHSSVMLAPPRLVEIEPIIERQQCLHRAPPVLFVVTALALSVVPSLRISSRGIFPRMALGLCAIHVHLPLLLRAAPLIFLSLALLSLIASSPVVLGTLTPRRLLHPDAFDLRERPPVSGTCE